MKLATTRWGARACFALVIAIASLALLSWISGQWRAGAMGRNDVPMAPSTALSFLVLAGAAWLGHRRANSATAQRCSVLLLALRIVTACAMGMVVMAIICKRDYGETT